MFVVFTLFSQSLTAPQVDTARKRSENHIRFQDLQFSGSSQTHSGFNLGIGASEADPRHVIEGKSETGQMLSIPFSEIIAIKKVQGDGRRIYFEVTRFPDISSTELVASHPNCQALLKYKKLSGLWVDLGSHMLYWLGSTEDYADLQKVGRVVDMREGTTMRLRLPINEVWWAIPSVRNDPLCAASGLDPLGGGFIRP